jgi:hypothetical protein
VAFSIGEHITKILVQRSTESDIQQLDTPAYCEQRLVLPNGFLYDG